MTVLVFYMSCRLIYLMGGCNVVRNTDTDSTPSDLQLIIDRYKRAQALGKVGNWEYNSVSREFWGSDEAKRIISVAEIERDEHDAPIKVGGVIQDICDRKKIEQALSDTTKRLENAQKLARVGYWDWAIESNRLIWSTDVYEMFGQSPDEFEVTVEAFEAQIHPDDLSSFVRER